MYEVKTVRCDLAMRGILFYVVGGLVAHFCAGNNIQSGNIVGYETETIRHGHNTIVMPENVTFEAHTVKDVLGQLEEGDRILYKDGFQNSWALVLKGEDGQLHAYEDETDNVVDECPLPVLGGRQVLTVYRESYDVSNVAVSGAYDEKTPAFVSEAAPLDEIKLDKDIVDSLTVTVTNKVALPFKTVISKQFDIVLKDGRRLRAMVNPRTSIIVDAKTEKPVNIGSEEIAKFELVRDDSSVPQEQKAEEKDISKISVDVAKKARGYNIRKTLRETVIGSLWDSKDVTGSIIRWIVATMVIGCIAKIGDWAWGSIFKALRNVIAFGFTKFWLIPYWLGRFWRWVWS